MPLFQKNLGWWNMIFGQILSCLGILQWVPCCRVFPSHWCIQSIFQMIKVTWTMMDFDKPLTFESTSGIWALAFCCPRNLQESSVEDESWGMHLDGPIEAVWSHRTLSGPSQWSPWIIGQITCRYTHKAMNHPRSVKLHFPTKKMVNLLNFYIPFFCGIFPFRCSTNFCHTNWHRIIESRL